MLATIRRYSRPLLAALLLGAPGSLFATNFELSQLATEISQASYRLSEGLRYSSGYSSVRASASRLSSEAEQLLRAVSYNRSSASIRAEFRDISRRYQELERDYLRASRQRYNNAAFVEMDRINYLFTSLSNVVYYGQRSAPAYGAYTYVPPISGYRSYNNRPLPQQRPGASLQNKSTGSQRPSRFDYGRRSVGNSNNFDHRSSVLDRQQRNLDSFSRTRIRNP
ncbi:MAG: hypothetical protein RL120_03065 [Gammaproteobacteria bacterium]